MGARRWGRLTMKRLFWISVAVLGVMISTVLVAYGPSPFAVAVDMWNDSIPRVDSCDSVQDIKIQAALDTSTAARDTASVALDTAQMALDTAKLATTPTEAAVIAGDSARVAAGDSLDQARVEMPDSARGVVHDSLQIARAEMPDSATRVLNDSLPLFARLTGAVFTGKASGKFYDSDTLIADSLLITAHTLSLITDDTTHWNLSTKKVFCYMYKSDSLVIDTGYVDTVLFDRTTGDFINCTPDTTSGWRAVTLPDTGLYQVSARVEPNFFGPHDQGAVEIYVYKDGAIYAVGSAAVATSYYINPAVTISTTVHVTASATIDIRVKACAGTAAQIKAASGATRCWMQVVKIN
jgi:hypothetical protein